MLEHLWLETTSEDWAYFKGLIQAAGGFVHLQLHFQHPTHRGAWPATGPGGAIVRLAEKNLTPFAPRAARV